MPIPIVDDMDQIHKYQSFDKDVDDSLSSWLVGKKLTRLDDSSFEVDTGHAFVIYHAQDCCEACYPVSIIGPLAEILGKPLTAFWIDIDCDAPIGEEDRVYNESYTWSHVNFQAGDLLVTIHWLGESNGYYGENINIKQTKGKKP